MAGEQEAVTARLTRTSQDCVAGFDSANFATSERAQARSAAIAAETDVASARFYAHLFGSLDRELAGFETIYIAPDGALDLVPFARLRLPDGRYWIERQTLRQVRRGRGVSLEIGLGTGHAPQYRTILCGRQALIDPTACAQAPSIPSRPGRFALGVLGCRAEGQQVRALTKINAGPGPSGLNRAIGPDLVPARPNSSFGARISPMTHHRPSIRQEQGTVVGAEDAATGTDVTPEIELSDADILDAMRHIPGYLDITTTDFRIIYHLAHAHAVERLLRGVCARDLMRSGIEPLRPTTPLDEAARALVRQGLKTLPVVDADGRVLGVLTETDVLRLFGAGSFLELLLHLIEGEGGLAQRCQDTTTGALMTTPAVAVPEQAGLREMMAAFRRHPGRGMPVVDAQGRCVGVLLRKAFLTACHLESAP